MHSSEQSGMECAWRLVKIYTVIVATYVALIRVIQSYLCLHTSIQWRVPEVNKENHPLFLRRPVQDAKEYSYLIHNDCIRFSVVK